MAPKSTAIKNSDDYIEFLKSKDNSSINIEWQQEDYSDLIKILEVSGKNITDLKLQFFENLDIDSQIEILNLIEQKCKNLINFDLSGNHLEKNDKISYALKKIIKNNTQLEKLNFNDTGIGETFINNLQEVLPESCKEIYIKNSKHISAVKLGVLNLSSSKSFHSDFNSALYKGASSAIGNAIKAQAFQFLVPKIAFYAYQAVRDLTTDNILPPETNNQEPKVISGHKYFHRYVKLVRSLRENDEEIPSFREYVADKLNLDSNKDYILDLQNIEIVIESNIDTSSHLDDINPDYDAPQIFKKFIYRACNDEQIAILDKCDFSHCDLRGFKCPSISMIDAKLEYTNLEGCNFYTTPTSKEITLVDSPIEKMKLRAQKFIFKGYQCNFNQASFNHADLTNTIFIRGQAREATFESTKLVGTSFYGMDLQSSQFKNCTLNQVDLRNANLSSAIMQDVIFNGANLYKAKCEEIKLEKVKIIDSNLNNVDAAYAIIKDTIIDKSTLNNLNLTKSDIEKLTVISSEMIGLQAVEAQIKESNFRAKSDLSNANFNLAKLENIVIEECKFDESEFRKAILENVEIITTSLNKAKLNADQLNDVRIDNCIVDDLELSAKSITGMIFLPDDKSDLNSMIIDENINLEGIVASRVAMVALKLKKEVFKNNRLEKEINDLNKSNIEIDEQIDINKYSRVGMLIKKYIPLPNVLLSPILTTTSVLNIFSNLKNYKSLALIAAGVMVMPVVANVALPLVFTSIWSMAIAAVTGGALSYKVASSIKQTLKISFPSSDELEKLKADNNNKISTLKNNRDKVNASVKELSDEFQKIHNSTSVELKNQLVDFNNQVIALSEVPSIKQHATDALKAKQTTIQQSVKPAPITPAEIKDRAQESGKENFLG